MTLLHGDCLERLSEMQTASLDSLVTDPPAGIAFMGKAWDSDKGGRAQWIAWMTEVMRECLRVLKPGAHGLVWALPRTSHWTATALEDAGFEVRDVVTHLFGTGFPKSLDVSKAIDRAAGAERVVVGLKKYADGATYMGGEKSGRFGMMSEGQARGPSLETTPATDAAKQWQGFGTALKPAVEIWLLVAKPFTTVPLDATISHANQLLRDFVCQMLHVKFADQCSTSNLRDLGAGCDFAQWIAVVLTSPQSGDSSDETDMFRLPAMAETILSIAALWNGILSVAFCRQSTFTTETETALTTELKTLSYLISPITQACTTRGETNQSGEMSAAIVVRRFLESVLAKLSAFPGISVPESVSTPAESSVLPLPPWQKYESAINKVASSEHYILIRSPLGEKTVAANVLKHGTGGINIDGCRIGTTEALGRMNNVPSTFNHANATPYVDNSRGLGRFPSNLILDEEAAALLDEQSGILKSGELKGYVSGGGSKSGHLAGKKARLIEKSTKYSGGASRYFYCAKASKADKGADNVHPTVKSTALMRYLLRLVTPPGGTVLDPFMGSGSTGVAAKAEGFGFIGIEQDAEYLAIAARRMGA